VLVVVDGIGDFVLARVQRGTISRSKLLAALFLGLRREQSIDVLDTLGNARLLVSFTLPGISRVRCGLSHGRNN
jgi:hypothetical protein